MPRTKLFWLALSFGIAGTPTFAQSYTFQDGDRSHTYLRTTDLYVTSGPRSAASKSYGKSGWITANIREEAKSRPSNAVPVFLDASELPASLRNQSAVSVADYPSAILLMTSRLLIRSRSEEDWNRLMQNTGAISHSETLLAGWHKVEYRNAWAALDALDWLGKDSGWVYTPAFARQFSTRATNFGGPLKRTVNDPLFASQWHFNQPSLNLNMGAAWDFVTGKDINITIVDDGLDINSPDLKDAAYPLSTNYHKNFNDTGGNNPAPSDLANHGTNCGGLAAARGFNGEGLDGVAPEARLMGLRLIAGPTDPTEEGEAMAWQPAGT
ncbi:MAG: S8 family serine peptidase, partial [Acidobacteriota bacterium]|nr:S8 family serine peptidase [Acidobacteriota bacterium]